MELANLGDVKRVFASWRAPIAWLGQTHLLCRGIEHYLGRFRVLPTRPAGLALCQQASIPHSTPEEAAQDVAAACLEILCLQADEALVDTCTRRRWRLVQAPSHTIEKAANKLQLPALLARAGLPVILHRLLAPAGPELAQEVWDELRSPQLVVQTAENNTTGRGTWLATSMAELAAVLETTGERHVKVASFVSGRLITISACATARGTWSSCLSRQLVGLTDLTDCWSAHCGNERLVEDEVSSAEVTTIRRCCAAVGRQLAAAGFRGHFGLDLILTDDGTPWVLEINPRLQSVSSLVHAAELERGEVPLQALHILELRGADPIVRRTAGVESDCRFSQVVIEHRGPPATVRRGPGCGIHQLEGGELKSLNPAGDLHDLSVGQCLVTPFCVDGEHVLTGDRLAVVQWRQAITERAGRRLCPEIADAVAAIRRLVAGEATP